MIRELKASLVKDFRILFRNWTSGFLVAVGPLLLMLVLIGAFSNLGFNNINLGYVSGDAKYDEFVPKINYLGKFQYYHNLQDCQFDLQRQKNHLCLIPEKDSLNIYFDNTRELISLILLNQIRTAATIEKEALLEQRAEGFIGDIREAERFLIDGDHFANEIIQDLKEQRKELQLIEGDLNRAERELSPRISQLEDVRDAVASARVLDDSLVSLSDAEFALTSAETLAWNSGNAELAAEFASLRNDVRQASNQIGFARSNQDIFVSEIDDAIYQLEYINNFLIDKQNRINIAINTIDDRSNEIRDMQKKIRFQRQRLEKTGEMSAQEMINPLEIKYHPIFTASERLKELQMDVDITPAEKQRLVNFGATQTFVPLILLLLISFISTILANILLLNEIHSPAFLRNQITPAFWGIGALSRLLTILVVTTGQSLIILLISYFVFFMDILPSLGTIVIVLGLLICIYTIIGMSIAYIVRTKTTSLLVAAFFLMLNILLGGIIFPVERMAPFMSYIAKIVPFTAGISILQQSIFYGIHIWNISTGIWQLVAILLFNLAFFIIARRIFLYRYNKGN